MSHFSAPETLNLDEDEYETENRNTPDRWTEKQPSFLQTKDFSIPLSGRINRILLS